MAAFRPTGAVPELHVTQPVGSDIDESSNRTDGDACEEQDDPDLTGVKEVLGVADKAAGGGIENAQTLALLCVLEDPIDGGEILVADAAAGAFGIPVMCLAVFVIIGRAAALCGMRVAVRCA